LKPFIFPYNCTVYTCIFIHAHGGCSSFAPNLGCDHAALQKSPFALHAAAWRTNTNELLEQLATGADVARRDKVRRVCYILHNMVMLRQAGA
jgi:hypothetical protein